MTSPRPLVSVVLACYNEAPHLARSFAEIREVLDDMKEPWEAVFVDDVSRDSTREVIAEIAHAHRDAAIQVRLHETNQGRGAAVTGGFRAARGEIVGYLDVDLEVHARYIPALVKAIRRGADVATVRRIYAFQVRALDRYLMSRGYSWLLRRLIGTRLHDTETGYKFFRRDTVLPVLDEIRDPRWFWDTEFMIRAERRGLHIAEVPGAYLRRYDKASTVRGIRDSADYFGKLLAFRRQLAREGVRSGPASAWAARREEAGGGGNALERRTR
jgi:glycosyltransferase AglD